MASIALSIVIVIVTCQAVFADLRLLYLHQGFQAIVVEGYQAMLLNWFYTCYSCFCCILSHSLGWSFELLHLFQSVYWKALFLASFLAINGHQSSWGLGWTVHCSKINNSQYSEDKEADLEVWITMRFFLDSHKRILFEERILIVDDGQFKRIVERLFLELELGWVIFFPFIELSIWLVTIVRSTIFQLFSASPADISRTVSYFSQFSDLLL